MYLKSFSGFLIIAFLLSVSPVGATVYKWTDDKGKAHFTDNKYKIPIKYRSPSRAKKGLKKKSKPPVLKKKEASKKVQKKSPVKKVKVSKKTKKPDKTAKAGAPAVKEKKLDPALLAVLRETKKFLEKENRMYKRLINSVEPNTRNGKVYMTDVSKGIEAKKALVKKLKRVKLPSLQHARLYLKNSMAEDLKVKVGGDGYQERIINLKQRMEIHIPTKESIIKLLAADLPA